MSRLIMSAALALAAILPSVQAQAQNGTLTRSFVSSTGVDTNACTIAAPCATFAQAYTKVGANGIVAALDPGKYGPISISTPVTINGNGWAAITGPSGADAIDITVNVSGNVTLIGLELDGAGAADNGINFQAGSRLEIIDCTVRDFTQIGIFVGAHAATSVQISNTKVTDVAVGGQGIQLGTFTGGTITAALDHVTIDNDNYGFVTIIGGGPIEALITDSHIDNNTTYGIQLYGGSSASNVSTVILNNVTLNDAGIDLEAYTYIYLSHVTQTSATGFVIPAITLSASPSTAYSDGTNHFMGDVQGTTSWPSN